MRRAAPAIEPSTPQDHLRWATEVLRAGVGTGYEWDERDVREVAEAVAEHLLVIAEALPSNVPAWLADWQRLARRCGVVTTPVADEPSFGIDALIDIKARLEQVADRAERTATRPHPHR